MLILIILFIKKIEESLIRSIGYILLIKGILYRVKELTIFGSPSMNGACIGVSVLGLGYALLPTITPHLLLNHPTPFQVKNTHQT